VHALVRIVLVCALVILLALIALREVQGIAATSVHRRAASDGRVTWTAVAPALLEGGHG